MLQTEQKSKMDLDETKRLLNDSTFYYIIQTNMEGRYVYINNHYRNVFGPIHGQIVGEHYLKTIHPDDKNVCEEISVKCFTHPDQVFPATIRKHDGNGGYIITQWEYKALFDENNEPAGVFCLGFNVTEHITHSEKLKDTQSRLAHKDVLLRELFFTQSHVIRKPLANIMGLASILSKMELDQNMQNICSMLLESCNELDEVIKANAALSYEQ